MSLRVSMLMHIAKLKEMLRDRQIHRLHWVDTRRMLADGLSKGSIDRATLKRAMTDGSWSIDYPMKTREAKDAQSPESIS